MADWDRFVIDDYGKATLTIKLDVLELPSGTYFLKRSSLKKLKNCAPEDLKNGSVYNIYEMIGHTADGHKGITERVTDPKTLIKIIKEFEEKKLKKED